MTKMNDPKSSRSMPEKQPEKQMIIRLKIPSVKNKHILAGILFTAGYKIRCEPSKVPKYEGESRLCVLLTAEQTKEQVFSASGGIVRLRIPSEKDQRALAEMLFDNGYTLWLEDMNPSRRELRFCIGLNAAQLDDQTVG